MSCGANQIIYGVKFNSQMTQANCKARLVMIRPTIVNYRYFKRIGFLYTFREAIGISNKGNCLI